MFKKILTTMFAFVFITQVSYAADFNITNVNSSNSSLLKVFLDTEVESFSKDLSGDVKVFKDVKTELVEKNIDDNTKLNILLSEELKPNTSYSFLSVYGVEGNIDFTLWDELSWVEINNPDSNENASSVFISSPTELEVVFKTSIVPEDIDVKVLRWLSVESTTLNLDDKRELNVAMQDPLEETSDYILMLFSLTTTEWDDLSITNSIYDFKTMTFSEESLDTPMENIIPEVSDEDGVNLDWDVHDVALNAAETPDTWAETWVLFALTFIMSSIIFIRRRFAK